MGFWSGVAEGFVGAAKGTWEGAKSLAKGGYALATDPEARQQAWETTKKVAGQVADYAGEVYDDPAKAYRDARDGASAMYTMAEEFVETADAEDWGKLVGAGVFEVGTALIPVGAAAKAAKLGKLSKVAKAADKIEDVVDAVDDAADAAKALKHAKPGAAAKCATKPVKMDLCFAGDTPVKTSQGKFPIRDVQIGDLVCCFDFASASWTDRKVVSKQTNSYSGCVIKLSMGSNVVEVTPGHPFWVVDGVALATRKCQRDLGPGEKSEAIGCWVDSNQLMAGDKLLDANQEPVMIERVEQYLEDAIDVFNLEIEELHNYCVGEDEVLAHNGDSWCEIFRKSQGMTEDQLAKKRKAVQDAWGVDRTHGHHIVHKKGFSGPSGVTNAKSQKILEEFGIDLVPDKKTARKLLDEGKQLDNLSIAPYEYVHSPEYVEAVHKRLQAAKEKALRNLKPGQTLKDRPEGANALKQIRRQLERGKKL